MRLRICPVSMVWFETSVPQERPVIVKETFRGKIGGLIKYMVPNEMLFACIKHESHLNAVASS